MPNKKEARTALVKLIESDMTITQSATALQIETKFDEEIIQGIKWLYFNLRISIGNSWRLLCDQGIYYKAFTHEIGSSWYRRIQFERRNLSQWFLDRFERVEFIAMVFRSFWEGRTLIYVDETSFQVISRASSYIFSHSRSTNVRSFSNFCASSWSSR